MVILVVGLNKLNAFSGVKVIELFLCPRTFDATGIGSLCCMYLKQYYKWGDPFMFASYWLKSTVESATLFHVSKLHLHKHLNTKFEAFGQKQYVQPALLPYTGTFKTHLFPADLFAATGLSSTKTSLPRSCSTTLFGFSGRPTSRPPLILWTRIQWGFWCLRSVTEVWNLFFIIQ